MPYQSRKSITKEQAKQMRLYSEIIQKLADYYPTQRSTYMTENNAATALLLNDTRIMPSQEWKAEGRTTFPTLYVSIHARDDWNANLDDVVILLEIFMPIFYTPFYYNETDLIKWIERLWTQLPRKLGLSANDHTFGVDGADMNMNIDTYLEGDAKGTMTVSFDGKNVDATVQQIVKNIQKMVDVMAKFWDDVANTENKLLSGRAKKYFAPDIKSLEYAGAFAAGKAFAERMISHGGTVGRPPVDFEGDWVE